LLIYEPNRVGYTDDSDDDPFLDFQLSFRFVPKYFSECALTPNAAFTTRLAQYIGVRESAPVVGKRFNPKLFLRWKADSRNYIDFGVAHESNGQNISDIDQLIEAQRAAQTRGDSPETVNDQISRGWNFLEFVGAYRAKENAKSGYSAYLNVRLLNLRLKSSTGRSQDLHEWELPSEVKNRDEVHGLTTILKWKTELGGFFETLKIVGSYETGIGAPFSKHSWRVEAGTHFGPFPVMVFFTRGYTSDLAQFNTYTRSCGFAFEFKPFRDDA